MRTVAYMVMYFNTYHLLISYVRYVLINTCQLVFIHTYNIYLNDWFPLCLISIAVSGGGDILSTVE